MLARAVWAGLVERGAAVVVIRVAAALFFGMLMGCQVDVSPDAPGGAPCVNPPAGMYSDFENRVNPEILGQCVSCHTASGSGRRVSFTATSVRDNFCIAYVMGPGNPQRALSAYPITQAHGTAGDSIFTTSQISEITTWVNRYAQ